MPETAIQLRNDGEFGTGGVVLAGQTTGFYAVSKSRPCRHRNGNRFVRARGVVLAISRTNSLVVVPWLRQCLPLQDIVEEFTDNLVLPSRIADAAKSSLTPSLPSAGITKKICSQFVATNRQQLGKRLAWSVARATPAFFAVSAAAKNMATNTPAGRTAICSRPYKMGT